MFRQHFLKMDSSSEGGDGGGGAKTVSYESHQKLLNEKKALDARLKALETANETAEQEKLAAQGNLQKIVDQQKQTIADLNGKLLKTVKAVGEKAIRSQFNLEASKLGCIDPELAFKAVDFSGIELDENFEFDQSALLPKIQELAKTKTHLFKKDVKLPNQQNLNNKTDTSGGGQNSGSGSALSKVKTEDLVAALGTAKM